MSFYPALTRAIRAGIGDRFGAVEASESGLINRDMPAYVLWMLERLESWPTGSMENALKAARWIGWINRVVENELELWDGQRTLELIREDVRNNFDKPH